MININVTSKNILDLDLDTYVYFLEHEFDFAQLKDVSQKIYKPLEEAVKQRRFTGKSGSWLMLSGVQNDKPVNLILLGLGDLKSGFLNIETYRRAIGRLIRIVESHKLINVGMNLPEPVKMDLSYKRLARETSSMLQKAAYHFDEFITDQTRKIKWEFDLTLSVSEESVSESQDGINEGMVIGKAINTARYWCDMPPSQFTPTIFANKAVEIADKYRLKAKVFGQDEIIKMGMGGLEAVSKGSSQDCKMVVLEYKSELQHAPTIAIVGKGITFDSGGLSIKPAAYMETMKDDMAGAAIVISAMKTIAQLKPKVNVVAIAPMSENMPGCSATKPGDVVKFYNGKTAEVLNTDAEGRLVLADALSYAEKEYKPDAIIDLATLTGACAYFLGPFYCGLMTQNEDLAQRLSKASQQSGDRVWRLPMDEDYRAAIKSPIADISNIGSQKYKAGAITAAFFLSNFVGNTPWAHLDIAGVAFGVPDMTYLRPGATGFGIRLLADLVMNWKIDK